MNTKAPIRFYWLDILRGLAALSIVLWHWQHFFFDNQIKSEFGQNIDKTLFPFYNLLRPFYGQGWRAVEFFFTLSGFIFFWLYSKKISQREISFLSYMKLRISRLYPLHLLTLVGVILLQMLYFNNHGFYFVYHDYRTLTFIGYLTLTFNWFVSYFSFNGPSWSVSVEMFLYILFFGICTLKLNHWMICIGLMFLGYCLRFTQFYSIGTGMLSFFAGGIAFFIYSFLYKRYSFRTNWILIVCMLTISLVYIIYIRYLAKQQLPFYFFELYMFPVIVICISLIESLLGSGLGRKFAFIGDISYSSYLIHFPLQLIFVLVIESFSLNQKIFYLPRTLITFYIVLIALSFFSLLRKTDSKISSQSLVKITIYLL
ncbi:acyltransferase family protein [Parapedobacter koreensis]|uniref:Peptidoglycan/LPS O-acetylase OafA/YrhL, contains acyltransferase and SGNH-hydrolase domains n=1 Tax=Parapedobacter koreensis TaxID=332977 RepID=A0A1H7NN48_9SPHI|nr:Peptidoglycan/LPS O-acetylase OafA/YrhL, contains acyltransferase and SGNH-hydrolase domains [Parapedobacter koreensis]